MAVRFASRIIVFDAQKQLLLCHYGPVGQNKPNGFWVPPGGALEAGETHRDAACRELREETGIDVGVGRELWQRRIEFDLAGEIVQQVERYFLVELDVPSPTVRNTSPEQIDELRWWSLSELRNTDDTVYPAGLASDLESEMRRSAD